MYDKRECCLTSPGGAFATKEATVADFEDIMRLEVPRYCKDLYVSNDVQLCLNCGQWHRARSRMEVPGDVRCWRTKQLYPIRAKTRSFKLD